MEVITDNTATLANALARIAELEAEREQALKQEPVGEITLAHKGKGDGSFFNVEWFDHANFRAGDKLYAHPSPVQPSPAVTVPAMMIVADHPNQSYAMGWNNCRAETLLLSTPTPPSAEQDEKSEAGKAMNWDYYQELLKQNGFCGITDLLTKYHALERSVEQPDSAAPEQNAKLIMDFVGVMIGAYESGFVGTPVLTLGQLYQVARNHVKDEYGIDTKSLAEEMGGEFAAECNAKPQRITEQDVWEILRTCGVSGEVATDWWNETGRTLLDKLNEHRGPDYKAQRDLLLKRIKPAVHFVRCGIGGNYGGTPYDEQIEKVYLPLKEAIAQCEGGE